LETGFDETIIEEVYPLKPAPFEYYAPTAFDDAVKLMAEHGDTARPLAGGQSLIALMNTRLLQPSVIIDLGHCLGVDDIGETEHGITLAAMVRQASAERSSLVAQYVPLLAAALPYIGGTANRNRGTVCGSLAHADPLAELPCVAVALDAEFNVKGLDGRRIVTAVEFFRGPLSTALEHGELLESVTFPKAPDDARAAFVEIGRNRLHGFAIAGVGVQVECQQDGKCGAARIAVMGLGDMPIRMHELETTLHGVQLTAPAIEELTRDCTVGHDARSDIHASSEYRRTVAGTLIKRALLTAVAAEPVI
jgi:CO/xanthine dehydrogenase FAD-binding subunit